MKYINTNKNLSYNQQIKDIIKLYPHSYYRLFQTHTELKYLYDYVLNKTQFMNNVNIKLSFSTRLKYVIENLSSFQKCLNENCNNIVISNIISINLPIQQYCCQNCAKTSNIRANKIQKSWNKKLENIQFKNEYSKKCQKQFNDKIKNNKNYVIERTIKTKNTKLQKYNDPNWNNRKQAEQTCLKRFNAY